MVIVLCDHHLRVRASTVILLRHNLLELDGTGAQEGEAETR
jgi:hypothetical protein